jgi:hypothetical protein
MRFPVTAALAALLLASARADDADEMKTRLQRATDRVLRRRGATLLLAQVAMRVTK